MKSIYFLFLFSFGLSSLSSRAADRLPFMEFETINKIVRTQQKKKQLITKYSLTYLKGVAVTAQDVIDKVQSCEMSIGEGLKKNDIFSTIGIPSFALWHALVSPIDFGYTGNIDEIPFTYEGVTLSLGTWIWMGKTPPHNLTEDEIVANVKQHNKVLEVLSQSTVQSFMKIITTMPKQGGLDWEFPNENINFTIKEAVARFLFENYREQLKISKVLPDNSLVSFYLPIIQSASAKQTKIDESMQEKKDREEAWLKAQAKKLKADKKNTKKRQKRAAAKAKAEQELAAKKEREEQEKIKKEQEKAKEEAEKQEKAAQELAAKKEREEQEKIQKEIKKAKKEAKKQEEALKQTKEEEPTITLIPNKKARGSLLTAVTTVLNVLTHKGAVKPKHDRPLWIDRMFSRNWHENLLINERRVRFLNGTPEEKLTIIHGAEDEICEIWKVFVQSHDSLHELYYGAISKIQRSTLKNLNLYEIMTKYEQTLSEAALLLQDAKEDRAASPFNKFQWDAFTSEPGFEVMTTLENAIDNSEKMSNLTQKIFSLIPNLNAINNDLDELEKNM